MIALGLTRLAVATGAASGLALLVDHLLGRSTALGFYLVGGFLLAAAVLMSTGDLSSPYYYRQGGRERRVSLSLSYVLAGAIVVAIGVAIEATSQ